MSAWQASTSRGWAAGHAKPRSRLAFPAHRDAQTPLQPATLPKHCVFCVVKVVKPRLSYVGTRLAAGAAAEGTSARKGAWSHAALDLPAPAITKSDAAFARENLEWVWGTDAISLPELNDLFEKVGFPRRDPQKLRTALANTHAVLWVRSTKGSRWARLGQMLGFARATSDAALSATIWDVAVLPQWQRNGLGRGAVERLTAALVREGITTITLYAEPNVIGMYEKLGFVKDPEAIKGMSFQRASRAGKTLAAGVRVAGVA